MANGNISRERKFSLQKKNPKKKNKDGDGSFLPGLQRRQNDNMATPETRHTALHAPGAHGGAWRADLPLFYAAEDGGFPPRVKSGFCACMSRAGAPALECLSARAPGEAQRVSASFEQPGPVVGSRWPARPSVRLQRLGHAPGGGPPARRGVCELEGRTFWTFSAPRSSVAAGGNMAGTSAEFGGRWLGPAAHRAGLSG